MTKTETKLKKENLRLKNKIKKLEEQLADEIDEIKQLNESADNKEWNARRFGGDPSDD